MREGKKLREKNTVEEKKSIISRNEAVAARARARSATRHTPYEFLYIPFLCFIRTPFFVCVSRIVSSDNILADVLYQFVAIAFFCCFFLHVYRIFFNFAFILPPYSGSLFLPFIG